MTRKLLGLLVCFILSLLKKFRKGYGISILVPFQSTDPQRLENWFWVKRYLEHHLPGAEIVLGRDFKSLDDPKVPFSKSAAVNDAASRSHGDILVILDADGYVDSDVILRCAKNIRAALRVNRRLWYIPYSKFVRLTPEASKDLLKTSPKGPYQFLKSIPDSDVQNTKGYQSGSIFGAMIQVLPRGAFDLVGGWDERFRGWGGEDRASVCVLDTLYCNHRITINHVVHIWHPMLSVSGSSDWVNCTDRVWGGQKESCLNTDLSKMYHKAYRDIVKILKLTCERSKAV